eukprot:1294839-Ditylum_brightwellii.AAC.1
MCQSTYVNITVGPSVPSLGGRSNEMLTVWLCGVCRVTYSKVHWQYTLRHRGGRLSSSPCCVRNNLKSSYY